MQGLIYKKILAVLSDVNPIQKAQKNQQQGYMFRGIDDMYNYLHPLFKKHGIFIIPEKVKSEREERTTAKGGVLIYSIVDYKFTFYAEDGSNVSSIIQGEAMDSGDKASNKAMSAALKYTLMQMFLIPTDELKELNTENYSPEPAPKKTGEQKKTKEVGILEAVKEMEGATSLEMAAKIWTKHLQHQTHIAFKNAKDKTKQKLQNEST